MKPTDSAWLKPASEPENAREKAATRALVVSILAYLVCPGLLHVYSLAVLRSIARQTDLPLSDSAWSRVFAAWALTVIGIVATIAGLLAVALGAFG